MKLHIKKKGLGSIMVGLLLLGVLIFVLFGVGITGYSVFGVNITNISVIAKVNVTNTEPNITSVVVDDDNGVPANEIDLTANGVRRVTCNATVFDYNGVGDINTAKINATFFINSMRYDAADDNNHHYTNSSCGVCETLTSTTARCTCTFGVQYYANYSSSWLCNVSVTDHGGSQVNERKINLSDYGVSNPVTVTRLLAINTTNILDYGNLTVTETSSEILHNVTNAGNTGFNLSLRGYGGTNESTGQNVTMVCDLGNITFGNQRYALGSDLIGTTSFNSMHVLRNLTNITNLMLPHRIDDAVLGRDRNTTLWRLQVPLSVGGLCNGTIIFGAVESS